MEFKQASEIKPKDYVIDPDSNNIMQIITIKPGDKTRIMYRDVSTSKISEIIVGANKQFIFAEIQTFLYPLNYYSNSSLYTMNPETFEEIILDGKELGEELGSLQKTFDSGKGINVKVEMINDFTRITGFTIVEEISQEKEKKKGENLKPQAVKDIKSKEKPIKATDKQKKVEKSKRTKSEKPVVPIKNLKTEENKLEIEKEPLKSDQKQNDVKINYKDFKGLGDKTFAMMRDDYKIETLNDLINADVDVLKNIPKVKEKKILEWQKKAKELLEKK